MVPARSMSAVDSGSANSKLQHKQKQQRPGFHPAAVTKHRSRRLANLKRSNVAASHEARERLYFFIFFFFFGFVAMAHFLLSVMNERQG